MGLWVVLGIVVGVVAVVLASWWGVSYVVAVAIERCAGAEE